MLLKAWLIRLLPRWNNKLTDPTLTNADANKVDTAIQLGVSAGGRMVEVLAIAAWPPLGWPIIKQIFEFILTKIDTPISIAIQSGATFGIIDLQVDLQQSAMSASLAAIQKAQNDGNPDELQKAINQYEAAQTNLVNYNGGATVIMHNHNP